MAGTVGLDRAGEGPKRKPAARCGLLGLSLVALCVTIWVALEPLNAHAMCDVIPGVTKEFRGALGSLNRPFAIPNDNGEIITVVLPLNSDQKKGSFERLPVIVLIDPRTAMPSLPATRGSER